MQQAPTRSARVRSVAAAGTVGLLATTTFVLVPATTAAAAPTAAPSCSAFDDPIYTVAKPNGVSLTTPSAAEARKAAALGFTSDQGVSFKASTTPGPNLVPVKRMYRGSPQDYIYTRSSTELVSAAKLFGYRAQRTTFYVSTVAADCLEPVARYRKGARHRLAAGESDRAALVRAGWTYENVAFYAAPAGSTTPRPVAPPVSNPPTPPSTKGAFSFAVIPDTQQEVLRSGDPRLTNRNQWLVRQKNLAFVAQTGDLVNWDTPDHRQMAMAKTSMDVLENAGIPYTVSVGNHDTMATGVGGSARDPRNSRKLQRDTTTLNRYFKASDFGAVAGAYEPGKVDNVYSTYSAGGLKWMVLSLEFAPRPGAVAWAKKVVAAHPEHNVLISTHSYLTGGGGLDASNQGYGDTSGRRLFEQLVSQYPNVKMVFSGHVGTAQRARVDTGKNGNKIYSFLTTMHDKATNPVRMFDVDPASGTVRTWIYAPLTGRTWGGFTQTLSGVKFVS